MQPVICTQGRPPCHCLWLHVRLSKACRNIIGNSINFTFKKSKINKFNIFWRTNSTKNQKRNISKRLHFEEATYINGAKGSWVKTLYRVGLHFISTIIKCYNSTTINVAKSSKWVRATHSNKARSTNIAHFTRARIDTHETRAGSAWMCPPAPGDKGRKEAEELKQTHAGFY